MVNVAESEQFVVELVLIARGVRFGDADSAGIFDDEPDTGTDTVSDIFFFHVQNTSDEPVKWWYDEHHFFGDDGFQYECGGNVSDCWSGGTPDPLPEHWYPATDIQPGQKARCVAEFANPPADVRVEEVAYRYEDDRYVIDVEPSELDDTPV